MGTGRGRDDDMGEELGFGAHLAFGSLAGYAGFVALAAFGEWVLAVNALVAGVAVMPLATYLAQVTAAAGPRRRARRQRA